MNAAKAISAQKTNPTLNRGCLIAFGSVFVLMGLLVSFFLGGLPLIHTLRSLSWIEGAAVITRSQIAEHRGEDTTYSPDIAFEYVYENQLYTSDRWSTGFLQSSVRSASQSVVSRYPVGSNHPCFINPAQPGQAVLDRRFQWINLLGCMPLLFTAVGAAIIWFNRRTKVSTPNVWGAQAINVSETIAQPVAAEEDTDAPWDSFSGPQKLRPTHQRIPTFLGTLFLCCFWNSLSWFGMISVWRQNSWLGIAFLSLFVAIGAILVLATVVRFLQLFNPTVTVAMSEGAVAAGESVDIAWETQGRAQVINQLKISLIGEEVATYIRGTDKLTDRKVFQRIPLVETADPPLIRFGSTSLTIPCDTIHSFAAENNKIIWSMEVHAAIRWWPDVRESMPFAIRPQLSASAELSTYGSNIADPGEAT